MLEENGSLNFFVRAHIYTYTQQKYLSTFLQKEKKEELAHGLYINRPIFGLWGR